MMLFRPWLNKLYMNSGKTAVYCALYFLPILAVLHTVAGGLICKQPKTAFKNGKFFHIYVFTDYAFPYLSIIISMISNAAHFSLKLDQSINSLIKTSLTEMKNSVIICMFSNVFVFTSMVIFIFVTVGHWLLLAYGIISLNQHLAFLAFVPFPAIFYIFTVKFTDPGEVHIRDDRNN